MNCRQFFNAINETEANELGSVSRAEHVRSNRHDRLLAWERETASSYSPSPVTNDEYLRRLLFSEQDVDRAGNLLRFAFKSLATVGFSTDRTSMSSVDASIRRWQEDDSRNRKSLFGYVELPVSAIREQLHVLSDDPSTKRQAVGIYDTALESNRSHAEGFFISWESKKKPSKSVAQDLAEQFSNIVKPYSVHSE